MNLMFQPGIYSVFVFVIKSFLMWNCYSHNIFPPCLVSMSPFHIKVPLTIRSLCNLYATSASPSSLLFVCFFSPCIISSYHFQKFILISKSVRAAPGFACLIDCDNRNSSSKGHFAVQWPQSWWIRVLICGNQPPGSPPAPPAHRMAHLMALCLMAVTKKGKYFLWSGCNHCSDYSTWQSLKYSHFTRAPLKLLCDTMKYQIISRAFYGCEYNHIFFVFAI